jgi:pimeloyl-ACP methyl ester carboxylesterase
VIERSADRGINPQGTRRQLTAILTRPNRTKALRQPAIPTLVIHGTPDPLMGISAGRATAAAIPGARMLEIDGMAHDLPRFAWPHIVETSLRSPTAENEDAQRRPNATQTTEVLWPFVGHRHNNEE